jgi:hypothetical protein
MLLIDANAFLVILVYLIDKTIPVDTWIVVVIPRRNPTFHQEEILRGVGRSVSEFFIIFLISLFFFI